MTFLAGRSEMPKVVIVVTGGVAAFKSAALVSELAKEGYSLRVVMTDAAEKFVGAATLAALSGHPVVKNVFDPAYPLGAHIELARWAQLMVVAPATANWIAKAATGVADDLTSTLYLAYAGKTLMAPAMNAEMWNHPAVRRNVEQVQSDGVLTIGPDSGWQACRTQGQGRMSEPADIAKAVRRFFELG